MIVHLIDCVYVWQAITSDTLEKDHEILMERNAQLEQELLDLTDRLDRLRSENSLLSASEKKKVRNFMNDTNMLRQTSTKDYHDTNTETGFTHSIWYM